ncbi:MAG TPA: hypothetical protein VG860_23045 [Terriglobia bacterium]|jgi:hypothetical protein|nr:hypothetical protein [Terriglobia bacterium]
MATTTIAVSAQAPATSGWIVSPRTDVLWFTVGGAAAAYIFWALWRFTHVPLLLLVAIWAIVFDETHGFATISRTYFDAEERAKRGRWLWGSLAFFLAIGPVMILLHLGDWLELATELWGYYHIFKQHYGFMMMYKKKNRDFAPTDLKLDKVFFFAAFYFPFLTYPLYDKEAAELIPFPIPPRAAAVFEDTLIFLLILITLVYLARQVQKARLGLPLNWPKQLLFAAAIPVNYLLFRSGMPLLGVYAAVTIFHNIQYHRLVWFYNQNKYGAEPARARNYGVATLINSRWLFYVAAAALYAIVFDVVPRFVLKDGVGLMNIGARNEVIFSFFAAPGLLHYWIDGHIWKVRHDPELREYLRL